MTFDEWLERGLGDKAERLPWRDRFLMKMAWDGSAKERMEPAKGGEMSERERAFAVRHLADGRGIFLTTTEPWVQIGEGVIDDVVTAHAVADFLNASWPELAELARQGVV